MDLSSEQIGTLTILIVVAAFLYSSVGHAGASGYLAAMAFYGLSPDTIKPAALCLNIVVAMIATLRYVRAGCFDRTLFWPFAVVSIPCAYLGGWLSLPGIYYKPLVGVVLIYAAGYFAWSSLLIAPDVIHKPARSTVLCCGAALGFLSGLTGVGGGIFLSPLLLYLGWAEVRKVSGVASAFILVNSISGLFGFLTTHPLQLPPGIPYWTVAAIVGGTLGSEFGARRFQNATLKRLLAITLLIAGCKMLLTAW